MIWWHLPSRILAMSDQQILLLGLLATVAALRGAVSKLQQVIGKGEDSKGGFGGRSEKRQRVGRSETEKKVGLPSIAF